MADLQVMNEFDQNEERDGIRFSWNNWPATKQEAQRAVIPVGCLYTPFKQSSAIPIVGYEPILCSSGGTCRTILNPYWFLIYFYSTFFLLIRSILSILLNFF